MVGFLGPTRVSVMIMLNRNQYDAGIPPRVLMVITR